MLPRSAANWAALRQRPARSARRAAPGKLCVASTAPARPQQPHLAATLARDARRRGRIPSYQSCQGGVHTLYPDLPSQVLALVLGCWAGPRARLRPMGARGEWCLFGRQNAIALGRPSTVRRRVESSSAAVCVPVRRHIDSSRLPGQPGVREHCHCHCRRGGGHRRSCRLLAFLQMLQRQRKKGSAFMRAAGPCLVSRLRLSVCLASPRRLSARRPQSGLAPARARLPHSCKRSKRSHVAT